MSIRTWQFRNYTSAQRIAAFWHMVDVKAPDLCWNWRGSNNGAYGTVRNGANYTSAHRLAFIYAGGTIPKKWFVCHKCDNGLCCNPKHLFAANNKENILDAVTKGIAIGGPRKLTDNQVRDVRKARAKGQSCVELAKNFNVCHGVISNIANGKTYKHVI